MKLESLQKLQDAPVALMAKKTNVSAFTDFLVEIINWKE